LSRASKMPEVALAAATRARPRPTWPTIIGVLSIVLGVPSLLGLVLSFCTFLNSGGGPLLGLAQLSGLVLAVNVGIGFWWFGSAFLLFLGGIRLIQRHSSGRTLHLFYAWIAVSLIGAYASIWLVSILTCAPDGRIALAEAAWQGIRSWLLLILYPAFLILWFMRPPIKQQVLEWEAPAM